MKWITSLMLSLFVLCFSLAVAGQNLTKKQIENISHDVALLEAGINKIESSIEMRPSFYTYRAEYDDYISNLKPRQSSEKALKKQLKASSLVLFADEHSNPESQRNFRWLMAEMANSQGGSLVVIIEWIEKRDQKFIDQYLTREISEATLRKKIRFDLDWGFNWESHIKILREARDLGLRVLAAENRILDNGMPQYLKSRDISVANYISKIKQQQPGIRILVSYGANHLVGKRHGHLSQSLEKRGMPVDTIIHNESNGAYERVLRRTQDREKARILRVSATEFYMNQGDVERRLRTLEAYLKMTGNKKKLKEIMPYLKTYQSHMLCQKLFL